MDQETTQQLKPAKVVSATIQWSESAYINDQSNEPDQDKPAHVFTGEDAEEQVDRMLMEASMTAPKFGGYDKTSVKVVYDNGYEHTARHDLEYMDPQGGVRDHAVKWLVYTLNREDTLMMLAEDKSPAGIAAYRNELKETVEGLMGRELTWAHHSGNWGWFL